MIVSLYSGYLILHFIFLPGRSREYELNSESKTKLKLDKGVKAGLVAGLEGELLLLQAPKMQTMLSRACKLK